MKTPTILGKGPEEKIVQDLTVFLIRRGWHVKRTHGNMYQCGIPDLWVGHPLHGKRWVEVKNALSYCFTPAQLEHFPIMTKCRDPIWILTAATESEYNKLFKPPNWTEYLFKCPR